MRTLYLWLLLAAMFSLVGCGGGANAGGGDPPPPPPPPPEVLHGTAMFNPIAHPMVCIAILDGESGLLIPQTYADPMSMPPGAAEVTAIQFALTLPEGAVGGFCLVSFDDKNVDGAFQQEELAGEWEYLLETDGTDWWIADVFGEIPEWGADATECADHVVIPLQYE